LAAARCRKSCRHQNRGGVVAVGGRSWAVARL
jgi:hypothetical protein